MNTKRKGERGFTLIELLVVVIIIGILAAIALPNFIGVQNKARDASVKANMRTTQIAAESYATDNGGTYPTAPPATGTQFSSYFPGGSNGAATIVSGNPPVNPFTNCALWTDYLTFTISGTIAAERASSGSLTGTKGQIGFASPANTTYAIEAISSTSTPLAGLSSGTTMVLSNQ